MQNRIVIATHHKTGTVWMAKTFLAISDVFGLPVTFFNETMQVVPNPPCVVIDVHSRWFNRFPGDTASRVFHLIRDPRDVVISAMHYHRTSNESWLHEPRQRFCGKTYQETINSLADDHDRFVFEMENTSGKVIRGMRRWSYWKPTSFEARYEDLASERALDIFGSAIRHLGFDDADLPTCLQIFRAHSIFHDADAAKNDHVRSGALGQWRQVFGSKLGAAFVERFGDVLQQLGYESDRSWILRAP